MRLLIAEDDPRLLRSLAHIFETEGYLVDAVARGDDALAYAESGEYDGLVLDIMMPGRDGVSVLQALRERGISTPALFLTAKDGVAERVQGLDAGADDYLAKPFGMMELMARIRAALRHGGQEAPKEKTYSLGSLFVDPARHIVRDGDREVTLTLKEFQVLCLLLERAGTVFTRDQLLNTIWGYEFDGASRTVDVHIRTLRQKLGHSGDCIETVRGIGYKISTDLSAGTARNE